MIIIKTPNQLLTKKAEPVIHIDKKILKLVSDMIRALENARNPEGVGLAAPQVGVSLQIFIIKPGKKSKPQVFINPKIIKKDFAEAKQKNKKGDKKVKLEGCLSISQIWGHVNRAERVLVEWIGLDGKKQKKWFGGFKAVIIQHEADHLQGILFTKRVLEQKKPLYVEQEGELVEHVL